MDKLDKIRLGDDEKSITVNYFLFHSISWSFFVHVITFNLRREQREPQLFAEFETNEIEGSLPVGMPDPMGSQSNMI
jgi:hypothetical protein